MVRKSWDKLYSESESEFACKGTSLQFQKIQKFFCDLCELCPKSLTF